MTRPATQPADLIFGAVQLGLDYGAANRTGKPSFDTALRLIRRAVDAGIPALDTARAYGDSEARIGEALSKAKPGKTKPVRTITKLSPLSDLSARPGWHVVCAAVDASIEQSLFALQRDKLDCLLLHRAAHMTAFDGAVWARLLELRRDGKIKSLGVSLQSPDEAIFVLGCKDVEHVQLPFNLLDWRWRESGAIALMRQKTDVTVHARSIFLQGLLACHDPTLWPKIPGVDVTALLTILQSAVAHFGRETIADLCLAYVRGQDWIDGAVIGMETEEQLDLNLRLSIKPPLSPDQCKQLEFMMPPMPIRLLDPAQWNS